MTAVLTAMPGVAGAGGVSPSSKQVAGAFTTVGSCGALSGMGMSWTSTANAVTTIVLTSIPAACLGGSLSLTLVGSGNASLASLGPVTITGTTQTFTSLTGSATATSVTGAYVSVVGP